MAEIRTVGLKDKLWHELRADLAKVVPNLASDDRLICCCCGRLLTFDAFSLEHIIPQQALSDDPEDIKASVKSLSRSGYTLLCNTALKIGKKQVSPNGCNSWKGRYFDNELRKVFNGTVMGRPPKPERHAIVSGLSAAYLAMFSEYGYQIVLTSAGLLTRSQFFTPGRFVPGIPVLSEMLITGQSWSAEPPDTEVYSKPFMFSFDIHGFCTVTIRNFAVNLPISRDPRVPLSSKLIFVPSRYKLRPDYQVLFD